MSSLSAELVGPCVAHHGPWCCHGQEAVTPFVHDPGPPWPAPPPHAWRVTGPSSWAGLFDAHAQPELRGERPAQRAPRGGPADGVGASGGVLALAWREAQTEAGRADGQQLSPSLCSGQPGGTAGPCVPPRTLSEKSSLGGILISWRISLSSRQAGQEEAQLTGRRRRRSTANRPSVIRGRIPASAQMNAQV